jgi:hypothetical protein
LPVDSSFIWHRALSPSRLPPVFGLKLIRRGPSPSARSWADKMRIFLGGVVIENHPGGGGSLGAAAVAHARPDGYTILLGLFKRQHTSFVDA